MNGKCNCYCCKLVYRLSNVLEYFIWLPGNFLEKPQLNQLMIFYYKTIQIYFQKHLLLQPEISFFKKISQVIFLPVKQKIFDLCSQLYTNSLSINLAYFWKMIQSICVIGAGTMDNELVYNWEHTSNIFWLTGRKITCEIFLKNDVSGCISKCFWK